MWSEWAKTADTAEQAAHMGGLLRFVDASLNVYSDALFAPMQTGDFYAHLSVAVMRSQQIS